jgi:VCBS repeat protein
VTGIADFNRDGKLDLVWQHDITRQVTVWYLGGVSGAMLLDWTWLSSAGIPGWTVVGANDYNRDGVPDLVWQNDANAQVSVWYITGAAGNTLLSWAYISANGVPGWRATAR